MKHSILFIWALCLGVMLSAQPRYAEVLSTLEQHSPSFALLLQQKTAQQAAAKASSLVEDPEVEFAYYWRSPNEELGNRWDLKVVQPLEMPSVYAHKSKILDLMKESAESSWQIKRQQLLLEAQQVCAGLVYYNASVAFLSRCVRSAQALADLYQKRLDNGDCGILDYNRVQLQLAEIQGRLNTARVQRDAMADNLSLLNGGVAIDFEKDDFEELLLPDNFEAWFSDVEKRSPQLHYLHIRVQQSDQMLQLSKSEWLPKLALGYASEHTTPEAFRGVTVGLNIPLWNNARSVTHAKLEQQAMLLEQETELLHYQNHLKSLFNKVKALYDNYRLLQQNISMFSSDELLMKAFDAGEISLEYYLQSLELYHDTQASLLEARYALEQAYLELYADTL